MSVNPAPEGPDPVLQALERLVDALEETGSQVRMALGHAETLRTLRADGRRLVDIVPEAPRPLVVEIVSDCLNRLSDAGSAYRRAAAATLYAEGLTMDEIARLFGVSRQRVSRLLRPGED